MNVWKDEQKNYSFESSSSTNFYIGLGLAILSSGFIGKINRTFYKICTN